MITVLGSLHMDLITRTDRIPRLGETVWGGQFIMSPGGKGMNQAVAAARLGSEVEVVGSMGDDHFGSILRDRLRKERITIIHLKIGSEPTGVASIMVDSNGNNIIAVAPGADKALTLEELEQIDDLMERSNIFMAQLEVPDELVIKGLEKACEAEVKTVLNLAPARELPPHTLNMVDVLVLNDLEAKDLAESDSVERSAQKVIEQGPRAVVVTLGKEGSMLIWEGEVITIPGIEVKAVDTTGAGDAFCGGLAAALDAGQTLEKAVRLGNLAGALSTTKLGAQEALPTRAEIEKLEKELEFKNRSHTVKDL
ncbi:MAG: ribokinase [Archaeoglobaceae archaeon]